MNLSGSQPGQGFTFRGAWAASTAYAPYDVLTHGGQTYVCVTGFTSGGSFDATNLDLWAAVGATGATGSGSNVITTDGTTTVTASTMSFTGATVTNPSSGVAQIAIAGSTVTSASGTMASGGTLTVTHAADSASVRECFAMASITNLGANQIPMMTSATTPSGTASSSTFYSAGYEPWRAMTGSTSANGWASGVGDSGTAVLEYDFGTGTVISGYSVQATTATLTQNPKSWKWEGSNDGSTWTTLDDQSASSYTWTGSQTRTFSTGNSTSYRYYRLSVLTSVSSTVVQVGCWQMYAAGSTVAGPVDVRHASLNSAATDCFTAEWGDGSGGSLTTETTFTNNFPGSVSAVVSVRV